MDFKRNFFSIIIGLALILVGIGALLDTANVVDIGWIFGTFWPLLVISLAVSRFLVKDIKGGVIMGLIGVVAQLNALKITSIDLWQLVWPLILVLIGFSIISKSLRFQKKGDSSATFAETTIFSGLEKTIRDQAFKSGSFMTFFGGTELDLTQAKFENGEAVIDSLVAFGAAELKVAPEVNVVMEVTALFGGSSDTRKIEQTKNDQTLIVRGYVLFGAIEVK